MDDWSKPAKVAENVDNNDNDHNNNNNSSEANEENNQDQINENDGRQVDDHVNDPQPSTSTQEDIQLNNLQPNDDTDELQQPQQQHDNNSSRLVVTSNPDSWKTSNAFFNYVADFKASYQNNSKNLKHVEIIQLASKRWRNMSDDEKHPYLVGANIFKKQTMLKPQSLTSAKIKDDDDSVNNKRKRKRQSTSKSRITKKKQPIRKAKNVKAISDDSDESDQQATSDSDDSDNDNNDDDDGDDGDDGDDDDDDDSRKTTDMDSDNDSINSDM